MSYSDDDYDAYDDYDDYDVVDHMTNDPIDFQINGYGGFGYDTSHIGPDEPRSEMCLSAFQGDLSGVMDIVERAAAISEEERIKVINYARKWTEVDYRASGFTKEWTWWDLTPVAMAAALGHHEVVQYLLEQGADPTLRGSPTENGSVDALGSAKTNLDYETKQGSDVKCNNAQRCVDLLSVANLFWEKASYSSPHYSTTVRAVFSNRPTNNQMLQEALQNVPEITEYPEKKLRDADLECLKDTASPMLMCSDCNESKHSSLFTEQQILMGRSAKCKECVRKIRVEAARGTRQKKVPLPRSSYGVSFGDNYYDDDYDDYFDNYDSTPVTYYRPDGDTEGKDVQWCKDKGFFEVEEGLWSGEWYNKTELVCKGCNESKHTALFSDRERMSQEFGRSPKCKVCARKEPSENFLFRDYDDDTDEVTFFRNDGETETKDVQWCLDNGFFEVEKGLWSGEWYYELDLQKRKSLRRQTMLARFSVNDKPSRQQTTKDTATASMSPGNTDCLTIRIKDRAGEEKQYKLKSATKMKKTFDAYAREKKVDMGSLRFTFCGVIVQPDETPAMLGSKLGLKDKSVIECFADPMEEPKSTSAKKEAPTSSTKSAPPLFTFGSASLTAPNSNDEKKMVASPYSFSYGKGSTDEKQKQKSPISFGAAAVGNSFSIGSSEKKKQATIKSTPIKSSIGFGKSCCKDTGSPFSFGEAAAFSVGSSEMKEKLTPTSANRQTQNQTLSFGSTEGNTSSSPFCFDATPQTMLGSPSRPGTSPSSTTFLHGNSAQSPKVPKSTMMKVDRNKINLSVESAISLLESLPPNEILPHQAARIKVLAQMLEGARASEKKDGVQSALFQATLLQDESLKRPSIERDDTRDDFGHVCSAVFDDDYLLSTILHFEGSLAMSETSYNLVVGIQHPKPYNTDEPSTYIQHLGTPSNALVCKKWKSFVIGEKGREAWTIILNEKDNKLINLAKEVVDDESMPWSARLLAMAIADDTASLYRAFDDMEDDSQGIGAAFEEADRDEDDDYEENLRPLEVKCPRDHPFSQCCDAAQLFTYDVTSGCEDTLDDWSALFSCNIAYAAAKVGSVGALNILEDFHGPGLWSKWFDDCGTNFIGSLVFHSCLFPVLEGPVSSVRHLLDNESSDDHTLHFRHCGCNGNNLHLAAARGHMSLVEVLLEGGMDPTEKCTKISPGRSDQRDSCVKELPLAVDWAAIRGHLDVAELLRQHQSLLRPDLRSPSMHYQTGKLSTFFPASSREYGFIKPGGIFVHLTQLRINSEDSNGFPLPGQKLCFTVNTDQRGRKRADVIFDGTDFSHLRLPLCRWEAELEWGRYKWAGTDDSEDNEDHEGSAYNVLG